ncbi:MAG TPA: PEP-CTERM sorting domain-containing protein [Verrucomicrobiae bacterium]|nr:PEP-CTERM sorting domain-containing protein [Verrucomicrobiae bacterium]
MTRRGVIPFILMALVWCTVSTATVFDLTGGGTTTLSTVVGANSGNSILVGDKLLSGFTFNATGNDPVNLLGADNISLMGRSNSFGFGIRIQGGFDAQGTQNFDYVFDYTVTVTNAAFLISDLHMVYNGLVDAPGSTSVTETFFTNDLYVGQISVYDPPTTNMSATVYLDTPVSSLSVTKDINVNGNNGGQGKISFVDQVFSQVPEPSSFVLVVSGLATLWFWRRRRS